MIRLKSYLSAMDEKTKGWKEMYEGRVMVPAGTPGNPTEFPVFYNLKSEFQLLVKISVSSNTKIFKK